MFREITHALRGAGLWQPLGTRSRRDQGEQEGGVTIITTATRWSRWPWPRKHWEQEWRPCWPRSDPRDGSRPPSEQPAPSGLPLALAGRSRYVRAPSGGGGLAGTGGPRIASSREGVFLVYAAEQLFTPAITGVKECAAAFFLGMALLLGFVLTAVATLRAKVSPRWSGILLLATGVGFLFSFLVAEELPPIAGARSHALVGVSLAFALSWIGVAL